MERGTKIWIAVIAIIVLLIVGFFVYRYTGNASFAGINDCYETDGGKNFLLQGRTYDDQGRMSEDFCLTEERVKEFFCSVTGRISSEEKLCEGVCVNGACTK